MEQKIFLLRHAKKESGSGDISLSPEGKIQAKALAKKILSELKSKNVTIWTSSAKRAVETSMIVKEEIEKEISIIELISLPELWSDNDHSYSFRWLKEKINQFNDGNLIIISHLEYVQKFPEILGFCENEAGYAQGVLIEDGKCINFN